MRQKLKEYSSQVKEERLTAVELKRKIEQLQTRLNSQEKNAEPKSQAFSIAVEKATSMTSQEISNSKSNQTEYVQKIVDLERQLEQKTTEFQELLSQAKNQLKANLQAENEKAKNEIN